MVKGTLKVAQNALHGRQMRLTGGTYLSQEKYTQDILSRAALTDHHTVDTPMELGVHLRPSDGEPLDDPTLHCQLVGSLVYLEITCPGISHLFVS